MAKAQKMNTLKMTQLAILIALEIIMAFTPIGMIITPGVAITTMHIPVIIGAVLLGPLCGGILGGTFGILSIIRAVMGGGAGDVVFNPAASGNPLASIVMAVLPRVLLGLIAAYLYILLKKLVQNDYAAIPIMAGISTALHTIMVLGCLWLFFNGVAFRAIFSTLITVNGLAEIALAAILATAVCKPLLNIQQKRRKTGGTK